MSELENEFLKTKSCFGQHEDSPCSWHCLGCIFVNECRNHKRTVQKGGDKDEQLG